jgi:hypothetical protein
MEIKRFYKTDRGPYSSIFLMHTVDAIPHYKVYAVSPEDPTKVFYDGTDQKEANDSFEKLTSQYTVQTH